MVLLFCLSVSMTLAEGIPAKVSIAADGPVVDVCFGSDGAKITFAYNYVMDYVNNNIGDGPVRL